MNGGRKGNKTRRYSGVGEEITHWRIVNERKLLAYRVRLATILRRWRSTETDALLKGVRRTGPSELGIASSTISDCSSTVKGIKAANSACGTPSATVEFTGALSDCRAGGVC